MGYYSIRELEKLSRVKAHTIRIWERRYDLLKPRRSATNIRTYTDEDLRKLLNVSLLLTRGSKISRVARMTDAQIHEKVAELEARESGADGEIERLVMAMMELDEVAFNRIIAQSVRRAGFEDTMHFVLLPFMARVGVLWQIGSVRPGQEHFISGLVRQKLIAAIDQLEEVSKAGSKKLVLFLPEGEWHELGLLFSQYILKKAGHQVIYLGQNVPQADLAAVVRAHQPDAVVTAFLTDVRPDRVQATLRALSEALPRTTILAHVAGNEWPTSMPPAVRRITDLDALREFGAGPAAL